MIGLSGRLWRRSLGGVALLATTFGGCATTRYEAADEPLARPTVTPRPDSSLALPGPTADPAQVDTLKTLLAGQSRKVAELEDLTAQLAGKVALSNDRIKALEDQVQDLTHQASASAAPSRSRRPRPPGVGPIKTIYQNALRDFDARRFEPALKGFTEVLTSSPRDPLADNAQFWVGECYYGLRNYTQAIKEFQKVFSYPRSSKDDDSQLKIGLCYTKVGNAEKAIIELRRLTIDYPESEYVSRAEALLRDLQPQKGQTPK